MTQDQKSARPILIVEDDESTGEFYLFAISQETPYHARLVTNGKSALEAVQEAVPCLIILDYHLPDMNGIELYDRLREREELKDVAIILMSASQRRDQREQIEERDMVMLNKPFDLDDFLAMVDRSIKAGPIYRSA